MISFRAEATHDEYGQEIEYLSLSDNGETYNMGVIFWSDHHNKFQAFDWTGDYVGLFITAVDAGRHIVDKYQAYARQQLALIKEGVL